MENEFMKRGYLLPEGCKDLMDVLKLKQPSQSSLLFPEFSWLDKTPPVKGEIIVPAPTTILKLATLLGCSPFEIINDLFILGVLIYPSNKLINELLKKALDFETASKIARKYGFIAKKAGE
jgi:hypothetical protein